MTHGLQVHPQLMGAARERLELQPAAGVTPAKQPPARGAGFTGPGSTP